jgi:hypothetical protein
VKASVARLLTRLYPRAWRERYGAEFRAFLESEQDGLLGGLRASANVIWSALSERVVPTQGGGMDSPIYSFGAIVRRPTAFLPLAMSLGALATLFVAAMYGIAHGAHGIVREPDEGTAAHIWQLLMAGQMPVLLFFAVKWLPRAPRQTLYVLGLQVGAILAAMAPVFFLGL